MILSARRYGQRGRNRFENMNKKTAQRVRFLAADILSTLGIAHIARSRLPQQARYVLVFHDIIRTRRTDLTPESQYGLTVHEFERIIMWLKQRFDFLTLADFLFSARPGVLLTCDDGKANNFTNLLPILEKYQTPAVLFVSTQHVVNPRNWLPYTRRCAQTQWSELGEIPDDLAWEYFNGMTKEQIARCGRHPLLTLGAHTVSHPLLTTCCEDVLKYELAKARRQLQAMSGQPIGSLAYPAGDYDYRVAKATQEAGYCCAFAVKPKHVGLPTYEIPRIFVGNGRLSALDVKLSGLYCRPVRGSALPAGTSGIEV